MKIAIAKCSFVNTQIISTLSRVQLTVLPNRIANLSYLGYEIVIILTPGKKS